MDGGVCENRSQKNEDRRCGEGRMSWCSRARCCRSGRWSSVPKPRQHPIPPRVSVSVTRQRRTHVTVPTCSRPGTRWMRAGGSASSRPSTTTSTLRRGGITLAAQVFAEEPPSTGAAQIDAAFAALADHLAERDGWRAPSWAVDAARRTSSWYPAVPDVFRAEADRESPRAFRERGIFITGRSLARA